MKVKAAVLRQMGQSTPYSESKPFSIEEIELDPPQRGEVLVEMASAGLCHSDLSVIDGSRPRPMPMVLGHEAAGIVREVGADVREFSPGDKVVFSFVPSCGRCPYCVVGKPALCEPGVRANVAGVLLSGGPRFCTTAGDRCYHHLGVSAFAQYTIAVQESLVKIGPEVPLERAALFGCAILTGVGAVFNTAKVEPGTGVTVFGLGGVGLSAILGAKAAGAFPIIAVDVVEDKLQRAVAAGATHLVNASANNAVEAVRELSKGGTEYCFESVGSEQVLEQAYQATRRGGMTVSMGLPSPNKRLDINALSLVAEERTLKGSFMGSAVPRRDIPRFIAMHQAGQLPIEILHTHTLSLDEINLGFDRLARADAVRQLIRFD